MRTRIDGRWSAMAMVLLLAACSGEKKSDTVAAAPVGPAPATTPVTPTTPTRPVGADAVDAALEGAKAFNAAAITNLATVETGEKRVRDQAARALEAARRGDSPRATAAVGAAEAARKGLVDGLATFQTAATAQQTTLDVAAGFCGLPVATPAVAATPAVPGAKAAPKAAPAPAPVAPVAPMPAVDTAALATYAGCLALPAEQLLLAQNVAAVTERYQTAETAYRVDRVKLDEAAATLALGR